MRIPATSVWIVVTVCATCSACGALSTAIVEPTVTTLLGGGKAELSNRHDDSHGFRLCIGHLGSGSLHCLWRVLDRCTGVVSVHALKAALPLRGGGKVAPSDRCDDSASETALHILRARHVDKEEWQGGR